jgi:hypothetical protein
MLKIFLINDLTWRIKEKDEERNKERKGKRVR